MQSGRNVEHQVRFNLFNTALVVVIGLGTSLVTSTAVASRAYRDRPLSDVRRSQEIAVKGFARQSVRADLAVWRIEVGATGATLHETYRTLEGSVFLVKDFLERNGLPPEALSQEAVVTTPRYRRDQRGHQTDTVIGYALQQTVEVRSADLDRVEHLAGEITSLIREGVLVRSRPPEFTLSDPSRLKREILEAATADARSRAEGMASNAGCRVGEVRKINAGVLQITRPNSTKVSSYGVYDTTTIGKDVSVPVTVTFAILPE